MDIEHAKLRPMEGRVLYFRSRLFDDLQPLAVCATDLSPTPKPLIVDLIPGTLSNLERAARNCEETCRIAQERGLDCVALRPCGRGDGSVFQGYPEVDVYEAIDAVRKHIAVDPDRTSVSGVSMGGAGTWYHASHYADFWSAAAPFCGYCDYQLWDKPGGTTFHRQDWEEFSWVSRDAAYRVPNLQHVALRIVHGEWDRAVGGGVPVEHSRRMNRKLSELGIPHSYIELPKTGHSARTQSVWKETVPWLLRQRRVREPNHVSLVVHTLRHNRAYWVAVEQQEQYGLPSTVEALLDRQNGRVQATTAGVRRLAVGPITDGVALNVDLDGWVIPKVDLSRTVSFWRAPDGSWAQAAANIAPGQKRPGLSGPWGDLFTAPTILVYGESGSDAENEFNKLLAYNAAALFRQTNGGVHRGGIPGDNAVRLPVIRDQQFLQLVDPPAPLHKAGIADPGFVQAGPPVRARQADVSPELARRANLFCVGNYASNAALAKWAPELPLAFGTAQLTVGGKTYQGDHLACFAVFPHPDGRRYVGVLAGNEPDAICWGSHVGLQLLPDYLVFDRSRVLDWGFFDNDWRAAR